MKYLLSLVLLAAALPGKTQYVLDGKIKDYKKPYIYLQYPDNNGHGVLDSGKVNNGVFRLAGDIKEPLMAVLSDNTNANAVVLFLEPKRMTVTLEDGHFSDAQLNGSSSQKEYAEIQHRLKSLDKRWKTVFDTLSAVNKRDNFEFQELKNWVLDPYHIERDEIMDASLKQHPYSYVTAYFLRFKTSEMSIDTLEKWYAGFPAEVKKSRLGKVLYEDIKKMSIGIPGATAKVFSSEDIDGKTLSLSDYKGKYVLLDFWASWCLPCRKGSPHLKELYTKYKGKGLEIIGISDDDTHPDAWRKAVEKDETGVWKHVLRGMKKTTSGLDRSEDKLDAYNVHSLPTKILIGPDGVIIGRYGGSHEEDVAMDNKLAAIFGE
jgi:thiol-disulfide isomerase/thioredoxin